MVWRDAVGERCFACNRRFRHPAATHTLVVTSDGQHVYVGNECAAKIFGAGAQGYQPPTGGPRLFRLPSRA